jgi:predicted ATPase
MSPTPDALDPADPLDALIASISDGRPVAWAGASETPAGDRLAIAALDAIARIADFNRGLQRSPGPEARAGASLTVAVPESAVRWGELALLEQVGTGASGEVWRAWDVRLQREVALKFPQARIAARSGSELESPLLTEARALARLRHPGVVAVYGIAQHDGRVGMWMELLRGKTLAAAIEHDGRLRPADVARIGYELAGALAAVHDAGLVHRDIKPANVILEPDGRVVLTDFGLGQPHGTETTPGRFAGTPMFMAPELFSGGASSSRSDLYALGVTLRWALTGQSPFKARTLAALQKEVVGGPTSPLDRECPDASLALVSAVEQAMAPLPTARFASAAELARTLAGEWPSEGKRPQTEPVRHALPAERDVFVGRSGERAELGKRFETARLVTLVGVGGMGKTRLAVRYGWQSLRSWPGGVWFCSLTEARDLNGIVAAVAGALGVPLDKGDPVTQLEHVIAARGRSLLILDNFEQVSALAGATVERWLDRAPEARFLVTSRERLNVRGEDVQILEPLGPESGAELFVERARRQWPEFGLENAEADAVEEVVRLTEGMPLAIELAAARIRMMTVSQVAERMRERFRLLGSAGTGRHASLRAVIDGSWDTLTEWEKAAFAQCAVFEGGFTLAAAEGVLDLSAWPEAPWVVDVVQALIDKSLLRAWVPEAVLGDGAPDARFGMYVTLHEYARQKLADESAIGGGASGKTAERAVEERHGVWYAQFGAAENLNIMRFRGGASRRVHEDLENLMAASRRALERGDAETALSTYHCAAAVLILRGPMGAALEMGRQLTQSPRVGRKGRAEVLFWIAQSEWFAGRMNEARANFEAALTIHREIGDRAGEASDLDCLGSVYRAQGRNEDAIASHEAALVVCRAMGERRQEGVALGNLGIVHRALGHHEIARSFYEAGLAIHREVGNRSSEGVVLSNLGNLFRAEGRLEEARVQHEAALAVHRLVGNRRSEGHVLGSLGNVYTDLGRLDEARAHFRAALAIHREFGDRRFEGVVLGYLGTLHWQLGQWEEAAKYYQAALAIAREVGSRHFECGVLGELGNLERDQGRMESARQHYVSALAMAAELGDQIAEGAVLVCQANLHRKCGQLDAAERDLNRGEAILRDLNSRVGLGKLLCERAELELARGNAAQAAAALAEAEGLAAEITPPSWEFARMLDHARASLGREA